MVFAIVCMTVVHRMRVTGVVSPGVADVADIIVMLVYAQVFAILIKRVSLSLFWKIG